MESVSRIGHTVAAGGMSLVKVIETAARFDSEPRTWISDSASLNFSGFSHCTFCLLDHCRLVWARESSPLSRANDPLAKSQSFDTHNLWAPAKMMVAVVRIEAQGSCRRGKELGSYRITVYSIMSCPGLYSSSSSHPFQTSVSMATESM